MKRTGYLGTLILIITAAMTLPGFGQAAPQAKAKQLRTQPEYTSYTACFNEKQDFAKKAELCEKFIADYKDSDYLDNGYKMIIQSYVQTKNWQKTMDTADKAVGAFPNDTSVKAYAFENAMVAAQNANNINQVISYGDKLLQVDGTNLNALITLSAVIPQKNPGDKPQLDRAAEMATKALTGLQPLLNQATPEQKPQIIQIDGTLHGTLGLIAYNEKDYTKSIEEYKKAIADNKKDDTAHYYLAYDYISQMVQASQDYQAAIKAENEAKTAKADQPTIDDLAAKRSELEEKIKKVRDMVIDELAKSVAVNGPVAPQAKDQLTKQWKAKNDDSTDGMDAFVNSKKAELQ
jgi:tetratricopeptide (TPR) repeat protein